MTGEAAGGGLGGEKAGLRLVMRERMAAMDGAARARASGVIRDHITGSGWWQNASAVMLFAGDAGEPGLDGLIGLGIQAGKTVCVPGVDWGGKSMQPRAVRSAGDLVEGRHGVRVPGEGCPGVDAREIGLVLVPGVAFDASGGRLGRGGGFYDRFLASWRGPERGAGWGGAARAAVGVCFAWQVVDRVPTGGHDERLDGLVTDAGVVGGQGMEVRR